MIYENPRVRFAPSPTGYLHVGGLRTALYNYLFAKNKGCEFILRIEDTDKGRYVEGAEKKLIEMLKWVGLLNDEGPDVGGKYGPYRQSERLHIYKKYAEELISKGHAYYAFDTQERLKELREEQNKLKLQPIYDKRDFNLSKDEIENNISSGMPYVVRLNVEPGPVVVVEDEIRGRVEFNREIIDDQVLIKSDGYPTYHLANVVDDHLMKITHVIRGEEWLSSTPKHVLLYDYFGWEKPVFAHLPLLLNQDRSKLSKRQGDVAVEVYKAKGYLKDALINFVALLGWSAGDNVEFYKINELIKKFSTNRVQKAGAIFNIEKLDWFNGEHIKALPVSESVNMLKQVLASSKYKDLSFSNEYLEQVFDSMKERITFFSEFLVKCPYFFEPPKDYDEAVVAKRWKEDSAAHLEKLAEEFQKLVNASHDDFESSLRKVAEEQNIGAGKLIDPVRLAVSGIGVGPGVFDLLAIIGKDEVINRINTAVKNIKLPEGKNE